MAYAKAGCDYAEHLKRKYDEIAEGDDDEETTVTPMEEPPSNYATRGWEPVSRWILSWKN